MLSPTTVTSRQARIRTALDRARAHGRDDRWGFVLTAPVAGRRPRFLVVTLGGEVMPLTRPLLSALEPQRLWLDRLGATRVAVQWPGERLVTALWLAQIGPRARLTSGEPPLVGAPALDGDEPGLLTVYTLEATLAFTLPRRPAGWPL